MFVIENPDRKKNDGGPYHIEISPLICYGAEEFCFLEGSLMEKEAVNFWREGMDF